MRPEGGPVSQGPRGNGKEYGGVGGQRQGRGTDKMVWQWILYWEWWMLPCYYRQEPRGPITKGYGTAVTCFGLQACGPGTRGNHTNTNEAFDSSVRRTSRVVLGGRQQSGLWAAGTVVWLLATPRPWLALFCSVMPACLPAVGATLGVHKQLAWMKVLHRPCARRGKHFCKLLLEVASDAFCFLKGDKVRGRADSRRDVREPRPTNPIPVISRKSFSP